MIRRLAALAASALLLVACGADDETGRFDATVDDVRSAVAAGDRDAALAHLDELGLLGMRAHADGALDEAELSDLGDLLDQARFLVAAEVPEEAATSESPPPPPEPVATPAPVVVDDDDDEKERGPQGDDKKNDKKDKDD